MQMQCHCNVSLHPRTGAPRLTPLPKKVGPASRRSVPIRSPAAGRFIFPGFRPSTRSGGGCRAAPIASLPQPLFLPRPANTRSPWDRLSSDFVGSLVETPSLANLGVESHRKPLKRRENALWPGRVERFVSQAGPLALCVDDVRGKPGFHARKSSSKWAVFVDCGHESTPCCRQMGRPIRERQLRGIISAWGIAPGKHATIIMRAENPPHRRATIFEPRHPTPHFQHSH